MPPKILAKTARTFLESQELFYILDSSNLRLDLSWKNKDQFYDLECRYCNAVYSDHVITNRFAGSRKPTSAEYTFLVCRNCGSCQNDRGIYKKKFYRDFTAGDIAFPNKTFRKAKAYFFEEGSPEIDKEITKLSCYKALPENTATSDAIGGFAETPQKLQKLKEPNTIFLCVTDALIASGLNPYEVAKRQKLIEFYATTPNVTHHDYATFNSSHNKEKRLAERKVADKVDKSALIKSIAKCAQFGEAKDVFAVETLAETMGAMGLSIIAKENLPGGIPSDAVDIPRDALISMKHGEDEIFITVTPVVPAEVPAEGTTEGATQGTAEGATRKIRLERKDGCVKTGILLADGTIIEDEVASLEEETAVLREEEAALLQSYINKTTGCKSETNVHEYLATVIPDYLPQGKTSISGVVGGVHLYGFIDAISGKQGEAPKAVIEIKKRMKQLFTLEELEARGYDLCQLILYKILTKQQHPGCDPKAVIVQSLGPDISIEEIPLEVQKRVIDLYHAGMREFKKAIEEFEP